MPIYSSFYVDGCENKDTFHIFTRAILACSDAFSLVYFRYFENEKPSKGASFIKKGLSSFKLNSRIVNQWPGTTILKNDRGHIYRMITYKADIDVIPIIETVDTLWDWCYPNYPMDPCFYKDGRAWFVTSTHERWNALYLNDNMLKFVSDFESLGVTLVPKTKKEETELFYNECSLV